MMKLIGKGNTAEVFEYAPNKICKLFFEGFPQRAIDQECKNARVMKNLDIPVPDCHGIINCDNRCGIIYERIYGKTLLEDFFDRGDFDFLVDTLVSLHTQMLACHTQEVISYKDFLLQLIKDDSDKALYNKIKQLPDGNCLCHGDFHPLNILLETDKKPAIIDFMNVCHGPRLYDVARSYFLITSSDIPAELPNREEILKIQELLAKAYLEKMKVSYEDIENYLAIISLCRKYE